ncbi:uncharacterized protein PHALS_10643 [Plasmopara halstedii]|uniref:Uncharacterized protein n=1 Tax=Plasmopara halstedii TaxID=4781 RepID=A0A0N7L544_PLAHL|nr:uncharacterized protein PHALS_10643 [Plasmopara halstedii]CEG40443.1 hypothetical protein PHALS_10643 [Plasmopara halstedii]|eukprot:XP_024576812.1 hypothetical protein PHALS_10643 [Plasmopara halstedii]
MPSEYIDLVCKAQTLVFKSYADYARTDYNHEQTFLLLEKRQQAYIAPTISEYDD